MSTDVWDEKRALRTQLRHMRATRSGAAAENATEGLTRNLIDLVSSSQASAIACYLSSPVEPNTRPFLNWAFAQVITILFPIAREDGLLDWVIGDGESERTGLYGIPEVVGDIQPPIAIEQVQLIIAPALAVDTEGNRLGKGRGYYDKVLGSMTAPPPTYAVVFDDEYLDHVPHASVDRHVDGVVTPTRIVTFPEMSHTRHTAAVISM